MTRWVEEDAKARTGLEVRLDGAQREYLLLGGVEIIDVEVEMGLLRPLLAWPQGGLVIGCELKGDRDVAVGAQLYPVAVVVFDVAPGDGAVEAGQGPRVTTVEGNHTQSSDRSHVLRVSRVGFVVGAATVTAQGGLVVDSGH